MALDGITGSGNTVAIRGADAVARPGGAPSALAARPRFDSSDASLVAGRPGAQRARAFVDQPADNAAGPPSPSRGGADGGQAFGRAVSAFVAQSLAQEQEAFATGSLQASRVAAGLRAYARGAGTAAQDSRENAEIIPPRLSSGHALDLSV
ncbi:MAG: hypothetical protein Q7R40_11275 [Phaeospirillum sp.]|nr:hypothetical protein [Phaeospirillum sp.]